MRRDLRSVLHGLTRSTVAPRLRCSAPPPVRLFFVAKPTVTWGRGCFFAHHAQADKRGVARSFALDRSGMSRLAETPIAPMFVERWSPRAMSGEALTQGEIRRLLEAARWAPSSGNGQPWRFSYALAGTPFFDALLGVLVEGNRVWCVRAGALLVIAARTHLDNGKAAPSHAFDTGAAWMSLALQGSLDHLVVHGMLGFDQAAARTVAALPESMAIQCMVAVGKPGKVEDLPPNLQAREQPSNRRPVDEWAVEGPWTSERT